MADTGKEVEAVGKGPRNVARHFDQELERFFGAPWPRMFDWPTGASVFESKLPSVDVVDREDEVCVRAELPGFKDDEIEVSVNDSTLTIKAESKSETKDEDGDYYRREISHGFMSRSVALPAEVDRDQAKARLKDGILEVTLPKVAKSKRQKVKIET